MEGPDIRIPLLPQEELDKIPRKRLDVAYASASPNQKLDIYYPSKGDAPYPVIIHFHGGAFMFGTKRDINLLPMLRSLERGYALVSVEYRLSGEARFPALIYDCKAAIRFLRANARELELNTDRVAAWGPSAGGYIASMLGVTNGNPAFEDLSMGNAEQSSDVQAVIDWCGPCGDFCMMDDELRERNLGPADHDDAQSPESRLLGCAIQNVRELSRMAAPATYAHANVPPFLIHHGQADGTVPVAQSLTLARAIETAAGADRVLCRTFPGKGHHGEVWFDETKLTDEVFAFLDRHIMPRGL